MWAWFVRTIKHKARWLDQILQVAYLLIMAQLMIGEAMVLVFYHFGWKHWKLKRRWGNCWICDSFKESGNTDQWIADNYKKGENH